MPDKTVFEVAALDRADRSKLIQGLVVPRPIGWIGTRSADGVDNIAPFSFYNVVSTATPTVVFSPGVRVRVKDTLANVRATGVFTVNVVTEEVAEAMNLTSGEYPAEVDEFALAGITAVNGDLVDAPMVAEAKANFECRLTRIVPIGDPVSDEVVFGEIVRIHVRTDLLDGTRIDFAALRPVGRLAGGQYNHTRDIFHLERPAGGDRG